MNILCDLLDQAVEKAVDMGAEDVLGFVLCSQGTATAPNGLIVYHRPHDPISPFVVHRVRFDPEPYGANFMGGGYHRNVKDAMLDFHQRVAEDTRYIKNDIPLTGQPQEV